MIRYQLICGAGHEFEAWFRSAAAYDEQAERGLLNCSECGDSNVSKALMAPNVAIRANRRADVARSSPQSYSSESYSSEPHSPAAPSPAPEASPSSPSATVTNAPPVPAMSGESARQMIEHLRQLKAYVEANAENVGRKFADEARRIHYEETEPRQIYGEATGEEAMDLLEEGIEVLPLPKLPEDHN